MSAPILGIDEAGRGCVLGALFVGAYVVDVEDELALRAAGAADSKALTAARRRAARESLSVLGRCDVRQVAAREIDGASLNALEEAVVADLVRTWRPGLVRMDALGPPAGIGRMIARIEALLPRRVRKPKWVVEPKADATFALVGAASIFAKTDRDQALEALAAEHGPLGSGYPHDPVTRSWLAAHAETGRPWPAFVRTKWETIRVLAQPSLF
jgi:ribonuclease HII